MPKDEGVDGRIKAETVSDYLERFYRVYLEDKLDVRCAAFPACSSRATGAHR